MSDKICATCGRPEADHGDRNLTHRFIPLIGSAQPPKPIQPVPLIKYMLDAIKRGYAVTLQPDTEGTNVSFVVYDMTQDPVNRVGHITPRGNLENVLHAEVEAHFQRVLISCVDLLEKQRPKVN